METVVSKVLPTLTCPKCGDSFTPIPRRDGSLPPACKGCIRSFNFDQNRELYLKGLRAGAEAKKVNARKRLDAQLREAFGAISERDAALFSCGLNLGYDRGYVAGHYARKKAG